MVGALLSSVFLIISYSFGIECVVIIPSHGIQLETHQGLKSRSLISSRRFIPFASLHNVVVNEGLYRWNVRYYLVAIRRVGAHGHRLEVAFEVSSLRFI